MCKTDEQDHFEQISDMGLKSYYMLELNYKGVLLALPTENIASVGPGHMLTCSRKDSASGTAAVIGVTT